MNHEEAQELLEDYVDERLDRTVRDDLEKHLSGCSECRSILDDAAPVDLDALSTADVDERTLRRAVRRSGTGRRLLQLVPPGVWELTSMDIHTRIRLNRSIVKGSAGFVILFATIGVVLGTRGTPLVVGTVRPSESS